MTDRFSDAFLQRIKDKVPITELIGQYVAWDPTKSMPGRGDMWACCPFHSEADPSFHALEKEGFFKCFVCGDGYSGDHFQFLRLHMGMEFVDAVKLVAEMAGESLPDDPGSPSSRPARAPAPRPEPRQEQQPEAPQPKRERQGKWTLFKTYDYEDGDGTLIYQNCRIQFKMPDGSWELDPKTGKPDKDFRQRRPSGLPDGSWVWGLKAGKFMRIRKGDDFLKYDTDLHARYPQAELLTLDEDVPHGLYRRRQVELAIEAGKTIFILEGEKAVDCGVELGIDPTSNSGGGENFDQSLVAVFRGADVVIIPDNDAQMTDKKTGEPLFHSDGRPRIKGKDHAEKVAAMLRRVARSVKVLELPNIPLKGDLVEWVQQGGTLVKLLELAAALPVWRPRRPVSQFGAVGVHDLHRKDLQHEFLIDDFLDRQGVVMVPGSSGSGKTFLILEMCGNIAMGWDFWGMKTLPGLVLYQAGEGKQGVAKRIDGWLLDRGIEDRSNIPFEVLTRRINLFVDDKDTDELIAEGRRWAEYYDLPIRMVVIDTFNKAITGANENAGQDMTKVLARLERISVELDCAVVVPIHKSAEGKMRGHTSLTGDVANVLNVTELEIRDQNQRIIRTAQLDKNKDGEKGPPHRFVLRQVPVGEKPDGKPITTCVVDRPNGDENGLVAEGKLSANQTIFLRVLRDAIDIEGIDAPMSVVGVPRGKRVIGAKAFFDRLWRKWPFTTPDNEPENRKKEFDRAVGVAGKALVLHGYVERDNDAKLIWWTGKSDRTERKAKAVPAPGAGIDPAVKREISQMDAPF
ncbi:hypothetical protein JP75_07715 [Devosia riboflavina]|uniref:Zinc finger CHC2-type domain-containing protein n=1 Tax=Devosia riboflavina TaxID=46914 RepID=A0A087M3I1_9HYPH|nr:AAA family ATPase [Devosia riboflavina]KFL31434.1 hypothetical protein JP75_07715 [Devosia riboflavina]